ncbi:MAG: hypothetical protein CSA50_00890 [Gammaproteobacteria bacterium]|nr:MAG: hypothetical protein CSA50_00890 [Gammaproteobacteria bacterium]
MHPIMNIALRAVRQTGEFLQQILERQEFSPENVESTLQNMQKIERQVHRILIQNLKKSYHEHHFAELGETKLAAHPVAWVIHPILNPLAFSRGLPDTLLSVVCLQHGKAEHSVLFNPVTGDEFTASKGRGATLNGKRVRVSSVRKIESALVAANLFTAKANRSNHVIMDLYQDLLTEALYCQMSGCTALDLINVASGKLDCLIDLNVNADELAGSLLFCQESGVLFGDIAGAPIKPASKTVVAANPKLFKALVQKLFAFRGRL